MTEEPTGEPTDTPAGDTPADESDDRRGSELVLANGIATAVLAVVLAAGVAAPDTLGVFAAFVSLAYLAVGIVLFVVTLLRAAERSRTEELSVAGLWFLAEGAPKRTRWQMVGAIVAQVVISLFAAGTRPYTALAFGTLAPMLGLGIAGWWSVRHGRYRPRRV